MSWKCLQVRHSMGKVWKTVFQTPLPAKVLTCLNQPCVVMRGGGKRKDMLLRRHRVTIRTINQRNTVWRRDN